MASSKSPANDLSKKARLKKLEEIIRARLGIGERWHAVTTLPSFVKKLENLQLGDFENAFGQMIRLGCKWEVAMACLTVHYTYNARQLVERRAGYDLDGELSHLPEKKWEPWVADRPPDSEKRSTIAANLNAAAGNIESHEDLLSVLGRLDPPPTTAWVDPLTDGDIRDVCITADEAVLYVQKLLRWCRKLLSDDSIGNFKTVESVGQLVPCVYVDVVAPAAKPGKRRRLPLNLVADILKAMSGKKYSQGQLRVALSRFEKEYPRVHRELRAKIEDLHRTSNEPADGWKRLFEAEARRRPR